jgi:hypothetical protein
MVTAQFHTKSTVFNLLINGRFSDILTPWHLELNLVETYIKVSKRNWYLIGVDTNVYSFRFIRNIKVDSHLFGADLEIRITGGVAKVYSIPKKDAKKIKELVIEYNNSKKGRHIIFH